MSATAPLASLEPFDGPLSAPTHQRSGTSTQFPLLAFVALAVFGALRWSTLLQPASVARLLGLVALAAGVAGPLRLVAVRRRWWAIAGSVVALPAALVLSGVPLAWVLGLRVGVCAHWIGEGLQALPAALIPYEQADPWVPVVIILGAGVLMLSASLLFAFAPSSRRCRAVTALPLVVLVSLPSMLIRPQLPYLQGLLLLGLLCALVWGDRLNRVQVPAAVLAIVVTGAVSTALAPRLDSHRSWIDVQALAGAVATRVPESFAFDQRYGPLHWPRTGREVFDVRAARADYWKVEDLDLFDGRGFVAGIAPPAALPIPDPAVRARFTQTIRVTIRGLQSSQVIAAGASTAPDHLSRAIDPGLDPGTWVSASPLRPGERYSTSTYSPQPSERELADAGRAYPETALAAYRTLLLPSAQGSTALLSPPFHAAVDSDLLGGPYGRAYRLAHGLAAASATPDAFVQRVLAWLGHGYAYDENTPATQLPLLNFLFNTHRGYCQQFSGAMALLLRLGGLPARVAGGFTTGARDRADGQWIVSDLDAHDWVEVWFPRFGWVRFDPTPASAPARAGSVPAAAIPRTPGRASLRLRLRHQDLRAAAPVATGSSAGHRVSSTNSTPWFFGLAAVAIVLSGLWLAMRPPLAGERQLDELERAFRRSRRPTPPGETLVEIELRLRHEERAARYVRAIRLERYAQSTTMASGRDRRALRAQLRYGLGPAGRVRALWALPPRRMR